VKHHKWALWTAFNGPTAQKYWNTKFSNLGETLAELDTTTMERVMHKSTPARQWWVSKHITGHFAHGNNMVRQGQ